MKVLVADICGLCYGANRAIENSFQASLSHNIVLYKEILHNKNVIKELKSNGAKQKDYLMDIDVNDYVIIRAHGEPLSTFNYLDNILMG